MSGGGARLCLTYDKMDGENNASERKRKRDAQNRGEDEVRRIGRVQGRPVKSRIYWERVRRNK
jgi:hypothetical protein